jgi:hypothetical protein
MSKNESCELVTPGNESNVALNETPRYDMAFWLLSLFQFG